jgi:flagellar protein FliO/FliZ
MLQPSQSRWFRNAGICLSGMLFAVAAGGSIALAQTGGSSNTAKDSHETSHALPGPATEAASAPAAEARAAEEAPSSDDRSHVSRLLLPRRSSSAGRAERSDSWYVGMAVVAVLLAAAGGVAAATRRLSPRAGSSTLQVVSRVSLSPKHTVYLMRAGARVLLVGTGPQGAPSLLGELDDVPASDSPVRQGDQT